MNKQELRKQTKKTRADFPEKGAASEKIIERFLSLEETQNAGTIALYCSMPEEVATDGLIRKLLEEGKTICVPLIRNREMLFVRISSLGDLTEKGRFGIREPVYTEEKTVPAEKIDLAVFPGLAFDRDGRRLGYGGGYYDRAFAGNRHTEKIGFCFSCQLLEEILSESHDIKVDQIITQDEMIRAGK